MKKPIPNFIGPGNQTSSRRFNYQRTVNMYPEITEVPGAQNEAVVLISRPGIETIREIGTGPIRGMYTVSTQDQSFIVSGSNLYSISGALATPVLIAGNLLTDQGPVSMSNNGTHLIIVDGFQGYTVELADPAIVLIEDENFFPGSKTVAYLGGYFILDRPDSSFFYISELDSIDFPPLNEQFAGSSEDPVLAVFVNNEQLYVFGTRSTETWVLTGQTASSPFSRVRTYNTGIVTPFSLARIGGTFCWVGSTEQGRGQVFSMQNDTPTRISTHAVERELQTQGDLDSSRSWAFQYLGHQFYAISRSGAESTLVFDLVTNAWTEWTSMQQGREGLFRADTHCLLGNTHLFGQRSGNQLYRLAPGVYRDAGEPLRRTRESPPVTEQLNNLFVHLFELDVEVGQGLLEDIESSRRPRVTLSVSRDSGYTWSPSPRTTELGAQGEYRQRVRWHQLGAGRRLVYRVWCDDPVEFNIVQAYLDLTVGTS